jgi:hypothetical protein
MTAQPEGGAPMLSLEQVMSLLRVLHTEPSNQEPFLYTLDRVSELTGVSLERLERECRPGRLEHVHIGNTRGMTRAQIERMLVAYTEGATNVPTHAVADDVAATMEHNRRNASRGVRRRAA